MKSRDLALLAGAACAACCIGPILALVAAIAALGAAASFAFGVGALAVAAVAVDLLVGRARRRRTECASGTAAPPAVPVAVDLTGCARHNP